MATSLILTLMGGQTRKSLFESMSGTAGQVAAPTAAGQAAVPSPAASPATH
jgi:hypothetical protein